MSMNSWEKWEYLPFAQGKKKDFIHNSILRFRPERGKIKAQRGDTNDVITEDLPWKKEIEGQAAPLLPMIDGVPRKQ